MVLTSGDSGSMPKATVLNGTSTRLPLTAAGTSVTGRRKEDVEPENYCWSDTLPAWPVKYEKKPLFRVSI